MTTVLFFSDLYCNHTVGFNYYSHGILVNLLAVPRLPWRYYAWLFDQIGFKRL